MDLFGRRTETAALDGLLVQTTSGPVRGFRSGNLNAFLGIPYASAGRWEPPFAESPRGW